MSVYSDKAVQREYQRQWIRRRRAAYLADKACVYCGTTEQLEINHLDPSSKVTHRLWSRRAAFREAELARCEVACRRCHLDVGLRSGVFITSAVLSPDDVRTIRRLGGRVSANQLASRFGVSAAAIRDALSGRTWSGVTMAAAG